MSIDETGKYVDRISSERAESLKQSDKQPVRKETKSPFDELLDQSRMLQQNSVNNKPNSQALTHDAVRESENRKERQKDESKDKERDRDDKQGARDNKTADAQDDMSGKRVMGKTGARDQQGGQGGGHGESHGESGRGNKNLSSLKSLSERQTGTVATQQKFGAELIKQQSLQTPSPQIPQKILEQLVRYIRVGLNKEGDKELQLDLHENAFRGLRLLLSQKNGKVSIHFMTADAKGKTLFEQNSSQVRAALTAKGIAVGTIQVT